MASFQPVAGGFFNANQEHFYNQALQQAFPQATIERTLVLGNQVTGFIGVSAAATVDQYSAIVVQQLVPGQTLTPFNPTYQINGRELVIMNGGLVNFTSFSRTVAPGSAIRVIWNNNIPTGAAWFPDTLTSSVASVPISQLTPALSTNTIDNTTFTQTWQWSNLSTPATDALILDSTGTTGSANSHLLTVRNSQAAAGSLTIPFSVESPGCTTAPAINIVGGDLIGANNSLLTLRRPDGQLIGGLFQDSPLSSKIGVQPCSAVLKRNIVDIQGREALEMISSLRAVTFNYKTDPENVAVRPGFVAEELAKTLPQALVSNYSTVDDTEDKIANMELGQDHLQQCQFHKSPFLDSSVMIPYIISCLQYLISRYDQ